MTEKKCKILVIEDERHIAEGIRLNLSLQGYDVIVAGNGREGLLKWKGESPDLIVLDIMLPGLDGYGVLEEIRQSDQKLPILILSAKNEAKDKVKALKGGVDDYMAKPFNLDEFLLRIERLLTRSRWAQTQAQSEEDIDQYTFGPNTIDFVRSKGTHAGEEFLLTSQELKILKLFIQHEGKPLSRGELLEAGWGYSQETSTRTVDNFMVRFRKYFESDPKNPVYFKSLRSVGYVFENPDNH